MGSLGPSFTPYRLSPRIKRHIYIFLFYAVRHCLSLCFFTQTFSADNEGFNGASNAAYVKSDENETERDKNQLLVGDKSDASDEDREDDVRYLPGTGFI